MNYQKRKFDSLHKQFFCGFDIEFPKKANLMADISNLKMVFVKITFFGKCCQKRKFLKRKLHVKNTQKKSRKILKNPEKIPTGLESCKNTK